MCVRHHHPSSPILTIIIAHQSWVQLDEEVKALELRRGFSQHTGVKKEWISADGRTGRGMEEGLGGWAAG
jgi:hypothetical protein